jgi:hypothetical protein
VCASVGSDAFNSRRWRGNDSRREPITIVVSKAPDMTMRAEAELWYPSPYMMRRGEDAH